MRVSLAWIVLALVAFLPDRVFGHALEGEISMAADVRVRVTYEAGGPLKNKPFWVMDSADAIIVSGSTDSDGILRFTPNLDIEQTLIVKDRLGHSLREKFDGPRLRALVDTALPAGESGEEDTVSSQPKDRISATAAGLGYLIGITGLVAFYLARKEKARAGHAP